MIQRSSLLHYDTSLLTLYRTERRDTSDYSENVYAYSKEYYRLLAIDTNIMGKTIRKRLENEGKIIVIGK